MKPYAPAWPCVDAPWPPWSMCPGSTAETVFVVSISGHVFPDGSPDIRLPRSRSSIQLWGSLQLLSVGQVSLLISALGAIPPPPAPQPCASLLGQPNNGQLACSPGVASCVLSIRPVSGLPCFAPVPSGWWAVLDSVLDLLL